MGGRVTGHTWKYDGYDMHKGEEWYKCSVCGLQDWLPSWDSPDASWRTDVKCSPQEPEPAMVECKHCKGTGKVQA